MVIIKGIQSQSHELMYSRPSLRGISLSIPSWFNSERERKRGGVYK